MPMTLLLGSPAQWSLGGALNHWLQVPLQSMFGVCNAVCTAQPTQCATGPNCLQWSSVGDSLCLVHLWHQSETTTRTRSNVQRHVLASSVILLSGAWMNWSVRIRACMHLRAVGYALLHCSTTSIPEGKTYPAVVRGSNTGRTSLKHIPQHGGRREGKF